MRFHSFTKNLWESHHRTGWVLPTVSRLWCLEWFAQPGPTPGRAVPACMLSRFSHVWVFATLWSVALQVPLSMGFSKQEYWSGLPCPPPGDVPCPGIEPEVLTSPALIAGFFTTSATWEAHRTVIMGKLYIRGRSLHLYFKAWFSIYMLERIQ